MMTTSTTSSKYGRVFDGSSFQEVIHPIASNNEGGAYEPLPPTMNNNNNNNKSGSKNNKFDKTNAPIFVSIPHFRDGKRCAQTLRRLFDSAAHPDRISVGLIEQIDNSNDDNNDPTCLMEYCALMGHQMKQHQPGFIHMAERQADYHAVLEACPRAATQIRSVRFHHFGSKGPVYARSFTRKLLGNEEFCMEIDASMDFAKDWDTSAIEQWKLTNNEYAVLSNFPLSAKDKGAATTTAEVEVPRQCDIKIGSEGVPLFENHADGKAIGLTQPLLSRTYSSSFVFSKCHYQTNVPQDPFAVQLLNTEQFPHFARLWTRGYDVYTPTLNLVFKDNSDLHPLHHIAGHGEKGEKKWPRNDNERRDAHVRMKVMLNIHHGITNSELASMTAGGSGGGGGGGRMTTARANLGIYGLGRRRTLDQLLQFASIALPDSEFRGQYGNEGKGCANLNWVPYDVSISPRANLFDGTGNADDLDLEPEFTLRTLPDTSDYSFLMGGSDVTWKDQVVNQGGIQQTAVSSNIPYSFVFLLWVLGLYVWYASFVDTASSNRGRSSRTGRRVLTNKPVRKVAPLSERALKNV
ncbi:hypothetical protein ACHAXM_009051 [Skeletonema potamos]